MNFNKCCFSCFNVFISSFSFSCSASIRWVHSSDTVVIIAFRGSRARIVFFWWAKESRGEFLPWATKPEFYWAGPLDIQPQNSAGGKRDRTRSFYSLAWWVPNDWEEYLLGLYPVVYPAVQMNFIRIVTEGFLIWAHAIYPGLENKGWTVFYFVFLST